MKKLFILFLFLLPLIGLGQKLTHKDSVIIEIKIILTKIDSMIKISDSLKIENDKKYSIILGEIYWRRDKKKIDSIKALYPKKLSGSGWIILRPENIINDRIIFYPRPYNPKHNKK